MNPSYTKDLGRSGSAGSGPECKCGQQGLENFSFLVFQRPWLSDVLFWAGAHSKDWETHVCVCVCVFFFSGKWLGTDQGRIQVLALGITASTARPGFNYVTYSWRVSLQ